MQWILKKLKAVSILRQGLPRGATSVARVNQNFGFLFIPRAPASLITTYYNGALQKSASFDQTVSVKLNYSGHDIKPSN